MQFNAVLSYWMWRTAHWHVNIAHEPQYTEFWLQSAETAVGRAKLMEKVRESTHASWLPPYPRFASHSLSFPRLCRSPIRVIPTSPQGPCRVPMSPKPTQASNLDRHLTNSSLDPHESAPQMASLSVQLFLHSSPMCPTNTQTDTQTHRPWYM